MKLILTIFIIIDIVFANYSIISSRREYSALDKMPKGSVADMQNIPQDPLFYAKQIQQIPYSLQLKRDKEFNYNYFKPWRQNSFNEPYSEIIWANKMLNRRRDLYKSRFRKISTYTKKYWIKNSNMGEFDSIKAKAITIRDSNLRALPTSTRIFLNPNKKTQGFPFDYNQNTAIYLNTPLYISHYSKDKKWALVHAPGSYGWIRVKDIALVDNRFINSFKSGKYGIVIKDNSKLIDNKRVVAHLKIGTIFPIRANRLLFATNYKGKAKLSSLPMPNSSLVALKPLKFTPKNVAYIARQLKDEPYAWGGILHGRDCSATTKDFFACFGIFLPRNSSDQAKRGEYISIKHLKGRAKKDAILKYAKPFESLLFVPGHIGIYIGRYKNEPIIMHTYWGIRLKDFSKYRLSRTIITTLEPGKERRDLRQKSKMSNTLKAIINF